MSGHSRALIAMLTLAGVVGVGNSASAQIIRPPEAPKIIHACYVPLTGTVYRVGETGLHATCTSPTHIPFQWTDGEGALRPGPAARGDLLQFDGLEWKPVQADAVAGLNGYEIISHTISNSYGPPELPSELIGGLLIFAYEKHCGGGQCIYTYRFRSKAPEVTTTIACPAGKRAIGVFGTKASTSDILADGRVTLTIPESTRWGPTQLRLTNASSVDIQSFLTNEIQNDPSTQPDVDVVKVVCADAT